jgi:hypothetical protein
MGGHVSRLQSLQRRRLAIALAAVPLLVLGVGLAVSPVFGDSEGDSTQPVDFTHNVFDAPAPVSGSVFGSGPTVKRGQAICSTSTQSGANANTDCEGLAGPHNETSIAVNPGNALNMIGGANDYQLGLNSGGHVTESVLSRAHVTFDGGHTWTMYPIIFSSTYQASGDPSVAFDAAGHAYYATLGFRFVGPANAQNPDIVIANSGDGGKTWDSVRVAQGSGNETSVGDLLDKEYVAAWGNGNAIVTYGDFKLGQKGQTLSARIFSSITHDGGTTWSTPQVVSGDLDQSFVAVPTVGADGRVFAAFLNTTDLQTGRDDYEVVELSPTTGARIAGPFRVATTIDGGTDYPIAGGRQTYQDSAFRSWAAGNITADPTNAGHLAVVWSDMRNSTLPAPRNPYAATTNSDVIVSQSFDHGRTWSTATALTLSGDQFQPWGAYDTTGRLRVGTFDRQYDPTNHKYDYSLSTETGAGTLTFSTSKVSTVSSDPTTGDRWFAANLNANFPFATQFLGDYSNIAVTPSGGVVAYWTDMREQACFAGRCASGEDAFFAAV